jgi:phage/plasmid-like protein (TIGR03299 family)
LTGWKLRAYHPDTAPGTDPGSTKENDMAALDTTSIAVTQRDLPFLKYRVADLVSPEHEGRLTADEALSLLGLDFTVEKRKAQTTNAKGHRMTIPGWYANVRTDTEAVLGLVQERYALTQNAVVGNLGNAILDVPGSDALIESGWAIRNGARMGLTLRIPGADVAVPGDANGLLEMFLMIENSHDGNSSVMGHVGPVRIACLNMIRLFKRSAVASFKIRHTSGAQERIAAQAREALGLTFRYSEFLKGEVDRYLNMTVAERDVDAILRAAFPVREGASELQVDRTVYAGILRNWQESDTIPEIRETAWGLINAGNEFFEHLQPVRTRTFDADSVRGISILQGTAMQGTNRLAAAIDRYR